MTNINLTLRKSQLTGETFGAADYGGGVFAMTMPLAPNECASAIGDGSLDIAYLHFASSTRVSLLRLVTTHTLSEPASMAVSQ